MLLLLCSCEPSVLLYYSFGFIPRPILSSGLFCLLLVPTMLILFCIITPSLFTVKEPPCNINLIYNIEVTCLLCYMCSKSSSWLP